LDPIRYGSELRISENPKYRRNPTKKPRLAPVNIYDLLEGGSRWPGQVRLDLEVSHGQQHLVVLQQRGQQGQRLVSEGLLNYTGVYRFLLHHSPKKCHCRLLLIRIVPTDTVHTIISKIFTIILTWYSAS